MPPHRVYVTDYGEHREENLPPELRAMLQRAAIRKDGQIDQRYTHGRNAWRALMAWDCERFMTGEGYD